MKPIGYHNAYYRNIPAYYHVETHHLCGRNWLYGILIGINIWFDVNVVGIEYFPVIIEKNNEEDK